MVEDAVRIWLPDFDHRIRDRLAVSIEHNPVSVMFTRGILIHQIHFGPDYKSGPMGKMDRRSGLLTVSTKDYFLTCYSNGVLRATDHDVETVAQRPFRVVTSWS